MRLDEYLEALQNCPDEQLKDELGIYDNWPIFLNADFDSVVEHLKQSGDYGITDTIEKSDGVKHLFQYTPGTVELQVFNWIPPFLTTDSGCNNTERDRIESERQLRDYNMTIILHPYQDRKIEGVHWLRALAKVADDIGQFAIRENIPTCMPRTTGWKYLDDKDYPKIVYHQPETPAPSQK